MSSPYSDMRESTEMYAFMCMFVCVFPQKHKPATHTNGPVKHTYILSARRNVSNVNNNISFKANSINVIYF